MAEIAGVHKRAVTTCQRNKATCADSFDPASSTRHLKEAANHECRCHVVLVGQEAGYWHVRTNLADVSSDNVHERALLSDQGFSCQVAEYLETPPQPPTNNLPSRAASFVCVCACSLSGIQPRLKKVRTWSVISCIHLPWDFLVSFAFLGTTQTFQFLFERQVCGIGQHGTKNFAFLDIRTRYL